MTRVRILLSKTTVFGILQSPLPSCLFSLWKRIQKVRDKGCWISGGSRQSLLSCILRLPLAFFPMNKGTQRSASASIQPLFFWDKGYTEVRDEEEESTEQRHNPRYSAAPASIQPLLPVIEVHQRLDMKSEESLDSLKDPLSSSLFFVWGYKEVRD